MGREGGEGRGREGRGREGMGRDGGDGGVKGKGLSWKGWIACLIRRGCFPGSLWVRIAVRGKVLNGLEEALRYVLGAANGAYGQAGSRTV